MCEAIAVNISSIPLTPEQLPNDHLNNASGGGLTLTTPTLTPTTLKRIQDFFPEQEDDILQVSMNRTSHPHQGGFVPPVVNIRNLTMSDVNSNLPTSGSEDDESSRDSDLSTSQSATTYNQILESSSNHSLSNDSFVACGKKSSKGKSSKKSTRTHNRDASKVSVV